MIIHRVYDGLEGYVTLNGLPEPNHTSAHTTPAETAARDERTLFIARVFLGVCLSIFLHIIVSVATYEVSGHFKPESQQRNPALMEWIEPSDLKKEDWTKRENQIVRKAELPSDMLDLGVKTVRRFQSEEKQTVKKEMRALNTGLTENRAGTALEKSRERSIEQATRRQEEHVPNSIFREGLGDIRAEFKKMKPRDGSASTATTELMLPSDPRRNRGLSTTGEALPTDIQIGDFTALNTDRFIYYTYYARIEEQIRHRWVRYVKAALLGGGDIPDGARELVTSLEIVLNREGEFQRAILHEGSGSRDVDAAPMLAFREAKRIPHPPREMVKTDGTIRLFYAFHVDQLPRLAKTKVKTE